jgi:hypothetical protein
MGDTLPKFSSRSSSSCSEMTRVLGGRLRLLPNEGFALVLVLLMSENRFFNRLGKSEIVDAGVGQDVVVVMLVWRPRAEIRIGSLARSSMLETGEVVE